MKFIADLHIHSRFSRATSKSLDFEALYMAARKKGITVVGTGDFTHPGWLEEIKTKLVPAENGLFALKPEIAQACDSMVMVASARPVRFLLATEISNIYKKNGRVRKVHHLVFFPAIEAVEKFNATLVALLVLSSIRYSLAASPLRPPLNFFISAVDAGTNLIGSRLFVNSMMPFCPLA